MKYVILFNISTKSTIFQLITSLEYFFILLSLTHMLKKILFWGRIFEVKNFNGFMCFESPEFKYMLLTAGLCTSVISIIKKQIITETPKLENYMLIM